MSTWVLSGSIEAHWGLSRVGQWPDILINGATPLSHGCQSNGINYLEEARFKTKLCVGQVRSMTLPHVSFSLTNARTHTRSKFYI
jgi:hypothetical protein